jgi:hypothetical protein
MGKTPDVSICIATYRRPFGLARLLDSLAKLKLPGGIAVEIVGVDNDAEGVASSQAIGACDAARDVRWFVEPRQNIALARSHLWAFAGRSYEEYRRPEGRAQRE